MAELAKLGCQPELRRSGEELYKTDNGNYIADCRFEAIEAAPKLALTIQNIPGVVDHGLFIGIAAMAIVGKLDGTIEIIEAQPKN
ncbi:Ribose-5-phosphate isomerase A [compost metagenome]